MLKQLVRLVAFAIPGNELKGLEEKVKGVGGTILTPTTWIRQRKAQVQVVILADPMDKEICFVGDEGFFRDLSQVDKKGEELSPWRQ